MSHNIAAKSKEERDKINVDLPHQGLLIKNG